MNKTLLKLGAIGIILSVLFAVVVVNLAGRVATEIENSGGLKGVTESIWYGKEGKR